MPPAPERLSTYHLLAPGECQLLRDGARKEIGAAAGRKRRDDARTVLAG